MKKLYKNEYGFTPRSPKEADTAAPAAPSKSATETAKAKLDNKSDISDNYDDDFDLDDKPKKTTNATIGQKKDAKKEESDDDWGLEDDWGEPASKSKKTEKEEKEKSSAPMNAKAETEKKKEEEEKKRREMFFGGDNKELDDLPTIGEGNTEK